MPAQGTTVGGGEGHDFLLFEYRDGAETVTYGYSQSWDVGFLDDLAALAPTDVLGAVRADPLPLNVFRASGGIGDGPDEVDPVFLADLGLRSWGEVEIGMSEGDLQAIEALQPLNRETAGVGEECAILIPIDFPQLGFMVTEGVVTRIDVYGGLVTTLSGVGVGATESEVLATYGAQIEQTPHPYLGETGSYLTFVPVDAADSEYRLIFETEDNAVVGEPTVTTFRAGRLPEVEWIEGCA